MNAQALIESGTPSAASDEYVQALQAMFDNLMTKLTSRGEVRVVDNAANLGVILSMHPDIKDCFAQNRLDGYSYLMAPIPGSLHDRGTEFEPRMLHDTDYVAVQRWLQRSIPNLHRTSYQNVARAIDEACRAASFDPLLDWVNDCAKMWDGQQRAQDLFRKYFVAAEQNQYSDELGKVSMMGLVLRVLLPGAPHRMIPVLQGKQGMGKSQGLAALCRDPKWFTDEVKNLGAKDTQDIIRKMFLIELGEMEVSKKAEREQLKAFLTRTHETFRRAYGRNDELFPRRCMFWGTTNEDTYLRDTTGNDRFYPIRLASVDVEAIKRDRDQLIGEAVHLLRQCKAMGQDWWVLSPDARDHLEKAREEAEDFDPWLPIVSKFVDGLDEVCTGLIMENHWLPKKTENGGGGKARQGLDIPKAQRTAHLARRISGILQKLGWRKDGYMPHGSAYPRAIRFMPPAADEDS